MKGGDFMKVKVRKHKKIPALIAAKQVKKNQVIFVDISLKRILKNATSKTISDNGVTHQVHTIG